MTDRLLGIANRLPDPGAGFVWALSEAISAGADGPKESMPVLHPSAHEVRAVFTTRIGGVSGPPVDSLNLSMREDHAFGAPGYRDRVMENRRRVPVAGEWSTVRQVHGAKVVQAPRPGDRPEADAVWTDDPARTIAVLVADCVPVLLVGDGRIAAVHAGWRGLVAGVVRNAAEAIGATEAWAGPAIGPCCYEVGADVADVFRERFGHASLVDERHVDLWQAVEGSALDSGVQRVHGARLCTSCHPELFFSHRRDKGRTGRQALVAKIER